MTGRVSELSLVISYEPDYIGPETVINMVESALTPHGVLGVTDIYFPQTGRRVSRDPRTHRFTTTTEPPG